jgi:hypothetical protein
MLHISLSRIYRQGSEIEIISNIGESIENYQETLKNTKIIIFFQFFKLLKQHQHQTNTLSHKYENKDAILDI